MEYPPTEYPAGGEYPEGYLPDPTIPVEGYVSEEGTASVPVVEEYVDGVPDQMTGPLPPDGSYRELHSLMVDGGDRYGVSAVFFDQQEELFWMGNQGGHMTSYYGPQMQKYTSFQVHATNEVRQIATFEGGVLSLTSNSLRCNARQGIRIFDHKGEDVHDMQCMLVYNQTDLLMGGHHTKMLELDLSTGEKKGEYEVEDPGLAILRTNNRFLYCGDTSGKVRLRDPNTMKVEHTLDAHSSTLSDFDVHGNQLVTCGFGERLGSMTVDRYLMVYDLRTMRPMAPLHIPIAPMYLRYVPSFSNRIIVVSQTGQFQLLDPGGLMTPESMILYDTNMMGDCMLSIDVSSSYHAIGFGDSGGYTHVWADTTDLTYNAMSRETEFAHQVDHLTPIDIRDEMTPISIIPMPYTEDKLLSEWPEKFLRPAHREPPPIDPEILRSMRIVQFIGYAPNPGTRRRNQVPYLEVDSSVGKRSHGHEAGVPESPIGRDVNPTLYKMPKKYRKVEIKYSKLGVDDFDFRHYNVTNFAGLEPHIPNAYCNSMLQVLYFVEPLRCTLESHLCSKEFCLACEMGLLFHMLDQSKGQTCQASNFLRAFRTIPEVSALGLLLGDAEESTGKANFPRLIQSWNRFVLNQMLQDTEEPTENEILSTATTPVVRDLFEANVTKHSLCRCNKEQLRESSTMLVTMNYPEYFAPTPINPAKEESFASVLQSSMVLEQATQAWCDDCGKYQPTMQTRTYKRVPDVLVINCNLETNSDITFWKAQEEIVMTKEDAILKGRQAESAAANLQSIKMCRYGAECTRTDCRFKHMDDRDQFLFVPEENTASWVPLGLRLKLQDNGQPSILEVREGDKMTEDLASYTEYYLHASVGHIKDLKTGGNLVAHIQVGGTYHKRKEGVTHMQWYLFNDFSIEAIEKHEAVQFHMGWKVPCVLYFMKRDINNGYDITVANPIKENVLMPEASLAKSGMRSHITFTPLGADELPKEGDLVGLDAEFVSLNREEAEIRSDGTRSTIKPSQMAVARISCVRGQGSLESEPFIDDYISTQEQVVDYLTKFSGIKPGDLDVAMSSKHLTTLKSTYLKLRYLIDQGAIFVGHGLRKDFRVINLQVPHKQVIDTAHLFNLPKQRILSLRFLAWFFLGMDIQSGTHDSIEDSRTALQLYRKYLELQKEEDNKWQKELKRLYAEGRKLQWKIPGSE